MNCLGFTHWNEMAAYLTSVGLGMSMLFSFNSFISAPSYVKEYYKYAAQDSTATTHMQTFWDNIESYISVSNLVPNLFFQFLVFTQMARKWKMQTKMLVSMGWIIAAMLAVPLCPLFKVSEDVAAAVLLSAVAVAGAATAFFQSTCFALLSNFPARFTAGILFGIGISGSCTSLVQIITKAAMADDYAAHENTSRIYFAIAIGWMVLSFVSVVLLKKNAFAQRCIIEYRDQDEAASYLPIRTADFAEPNNAEKEKLPYDDMQSLHSTQASTSVVMVIKKIYPVMFSTFLTFTITLTVFPGVGVSINSSAWFGIIIIFMFNFGDTIGRFASNLPKIWIPRRFIPYASISRLVVVPLFFFCLDPRWIKGDVFPMILMFITGVSNGFIGSLSMIYGPQYETLDTDAEKSLAGNCMSTALLGGCALGSCFALLINYLVPGESG